MKNVLQSLNIARLLKIASYTTCGHTRNTVCVQQDTSFLIVWPTNCKFNRVNNHDFLRSNTIVASSTACSTTTLVVFQNNFTYVAREVSRFTELARSD